MSSGARWPGLVVGSFGLEDQLHLQVEGPLVVFAAGEEVGEGAGGGDEGAGAGLIVLHLPFTPGAWIGDVKSEPVQTLEALELEGLESWGAVDPVLVSEILRDIERMAEVR